MRLIDAEKIKIPTSMIHNINGCFVIRVEDVQRIISDQPTAFHKGMFLCPDSKACAEMYGEGPEAEEPKKEGIG